MGEGESSRQSRRFDAGGILCVFQAFLRGPRRSPAKRVRWGEEEETERFFKALSRRALKKERSFFRRRAAGKDPTECCAYWYKF